MGRNYNILNKFILSIFLIGCIKFSYSQGNNPCTATAMAVNSGVCGTYTSGTTVGATYSNNAANGGTPTCASPGAPDVWYSFVAPLSGQIIIAMTAGTMTDSGIQLYASSDNTCTGTLTAYNCNDDSGPGLMSELNLCGLTGGNTYFLRVWAYGGSNTGSFNICFYVASIAAASTNCTGATTLCNDVAFSGNSSGAGTAELNACNRGCLSVEHQSSWYYFTTPSAGNLDLTISPSNGTDDYDFAIWGPFTTSTIPCPPNGTPLRCSWAGGGGNTGVSSANNAPQTDLTEGAGGNKWVQTIVTGAGSTYILLVDNFVSSAQPFTLNWTLTGGATLGCTPLPIELLFFTAQLEGNKVNLNWSTATEINNDFFTIEKSTDGTNFEFVTKVNGAGNSTAVLNYSTIDLSPLGGISYYRLKQTDYNGVSSLSILTEIQYFGEGNFSFDVFPNPNDGRTFNVGVNAEKGNEVEVIIYDQVGRPVYSKTISTEGNGNNVYSVTPSVQLSPGLYMVTAKSLNSIHTKRLVVK
ncbi:hypothetical protein BH10BAC1_BH10BAC1_04270 [soil metagenome]